MAHPGDDGRFGALLDGGPLRPGHGATSDWNGMLGDRFCHFVCELEMILMESEKVEHRLLKLLGIGLLRFRATRATGFEF